MYRWIRLQQNGISIERLLNERGYRHIALYAFTDIARCVFYELSKSEIEVEYFIDQQGKNIQIDYPAFTPDEIDGLDVDVIIGCYIDDGILYKDLKKQFKCDVIEIGELLYEL